MNNQITNPKTEVPKGYNLNDKDYLTDILSKEKAYVKDYATALTEASNKTLFSKLKNDFEAILSLQRKAFETMFRFGWYPLEAIDNNKKQTKLETLEQELQNLNEPNS